MSITFFCLVCYTLPWKDAYPINYDLFISYARQDNQQGCRPETLSVLEFVRLTNALGQPVE